MSTTMLDFRVREEMAGAVLKEVAALEPAERLQEAQALTRMVAQAVQGLEDLWQNLREPLQHGISPSAATTLAQILTRSSNLIGSSLELLVGDGLALKEFKERIIVRLQHLKMRAASLRGLVDMPAAAPDLQHLSSSLEHVEKGDAMDLEAYLAELKG